MGGIVKVVGGGVSKGPPALLGSRRERLAFEGSVIVLVPVV